MDEAWSGSGLMVVESSGWVSGIKEAEDVGAEMRWGLSWGVELVRSNNYIVNLLVPPPYSF